ncbi:MAG TPA: S8 family serine peptidase, partial [Streptosporangiaceae bacterium]|nr:S8 family serine peptidase [Streptosporangiaceae bacterium]
WVVAAGAPAFADQVRNQEWWLSALQVRQAWQASSGAGVTVAVLSDGVSSTQADIAGTVTTGPDFTGTAQATGPFFGQQGTAIASLIAGRGHGAGHASGILGVAPRSRILSVRVTLDPADTALDSATAGARLPDSIAQGIRYAVAHHAKVIELPQDPGQPDPAVVAAIPIHRSPDGTMPTHPTQLAGITAAAGGSAAEQAAVAYALRKKVVLVAPAGDNADGTDAVSYPAAYHGVISVGAFSRSFARAPYSSRQPYVTLTAAGEGVMAATADGSYAEVNSTDAASAVVAGVAALIRSRYPALTPAQVSRALTTSTVFKPAAATAAGSGAGTADAQRALLAAAAMAAPADARAGAGAQVFASPATPHASPVSSHALAPRILRAAAISAGVLIVLLLVVVWYSAVARRRARRRGPSTAQWAAAGQSAYSPYGPADADKMLEFFAAPAGEPAAATGPFQQFQAGQLSGAGFGSGQAAESGGTGTAGDAGGSAVGAWVPIGGSARAASRPPVSGTPPWEPAAKPASELPWASAPGPARGAASRAAAAARPGAGEAASIWPAGGGTAGDGTPAAPANGGVTSSWENLAAGSAASAPAASAPAAPAAPTGSGIGRHGLAAPAAGEAAAWGAAGGDAAGGGPVPGEAGDGAPPELLTPGSGRRRSQRAADSVPRSPSGSNWELPDSEPAPSAPGAADSGLVSGSDSFRPPAAGAGGWVPPAGEARWQLPSSPASQLSPSSSSSEPSWPAPHPGGTQEPDAANAGAGAQNEPPEPDMHWLPAAASDQWASAAEPRWDTAGPEAQAWGSAAAETPHWTAAGQPAATGGSPAGAGWESAAAGAQDWEAAAASTAAAARAAASAPWEPAAEPPGWGSAASAAPARPAAPGGDSGSEWRRTAWRPGASTESFPAVTDD